MKWRIAIGAAVLAVVVAVVGTVVALAGGSTGPAARRLTTHPAEFWLRQHAFLMPGSHGRVDVSDIARTLLGLEPGFRAAHHVDTYNADFRDDLVTQACTYVFGHAARINRALHVQRYRFDLQASGPTVSPRRPGGADHDGTALQCGFSHGPLGARLLELGLSSGGLTLHNLTTYATARAHDVTAGVSFNARPHGVAGKPHVRDFLARRLDRAAYLG